METKSMMAATEAHNSNTFNTFLSVLDQAPALLSACTSLDEPTSIKLDTFTYSGRLKVLRLVSQGARAAVSRVVTSFELTLNPDPGQDVSKMAQLLQGACLKRFGVRVIDTEFPWHQPYPEAATKDGASMQALQLNLFLAAAKDALSTVKDVTYTHSDSGKTPQGGDPLGLSAIPNFCSNVQSLSITGWVDPAFLQLLGSNVTKFAFSLQNMHNYDIRPPKTHHALLERLHEHLPLLTELTISKYWPKHPDGSGGAMELYNLTGLTSLDHLILPDTTIHPALWDSFPKTLRQVSCSGVDGGPLSSLNHLQVLCLTDCNDDISLKSLAEFLRAVPGLQHVQSAANVMSVDISTDDASDAPYSDPINVVNFKQDISLLDNLHKSGVVPQTIGLWLWDSGQLCEILQALPVLPSVSVVSIHEWTRCLEHMTAPQYTSEVLRLLVSVFPNMEDLRLVDITMLDDKMLFLMAPLQKLKTFAIWRSPNVTCQGLTALVRQLPALQSLSYNQITRSSSNHCEHETDEDVLLLQSMLESMGSKVLVIQH